MNSKNAADMIKKMKESIEHQAQTKKAEMERNSEQEASQIVGRQTNQAKSKINEDEKFRRKQIIDQKAVKLSIVNGLQRMKLLKARDEAVNQAMQRAEDQLKQYVQTPEYPDLLCKICVQSLLLLGEQKVEFAFTENDAQIFDSKKDEIINIYKEKRKAQSEQRQEAQQEPEIEICKSSYVLPDAAIGGCVAIAQEGTIQCSNTLMDRLALSCTDLYPRIKEILFEK